MKFSLLILSVLAPLASVAQTTVFSDTFTSGNDTISTVLGSNTNGQLSYASPTATSAQYDIVANKAANTSNGTAITTGTLTLGIQGTGSGFVETQALFTSTPITLTNNGDTIELTVTFVDTANVFNGNATTGANLTLGLFNSGGSNPYGNLSNTGVTNTSGSGTGVLPNILTAGAVPWTGYDGQVAYSGSATTASSAIITRPAQSGTTSEVQAATQGNSQGGFHNPPQFNIAATSGTVSTPLLTPGSSYTLDFTIVSSGTSLTLTNTLFNGIGTGGSTLFTETGTVLASSTNFVTSSFNALAIGYRAGTSPSTATTLPITSINVTTTVPEPTTLAMLVGGIGMLIGLTRFRKR